MPPPCRFCAALGAYGWNGDQCADPRCISGKVPKEILDRLDAWPEKHRYTSLHNAAYHVLAEVVRERDALIAAAGDALASLEILRAIADGNSFHSLGEIKVGDEFLMDAAKRLLKRLSYAVRSGT